jgi:hypothetical protein
MKKHLLEIMAVAGLFAAMIVPASAEASVTDAIERYRLGDPGMFAFFAGSLSSLNWANAELKATGHPELFCPPTSVVLSVQQEVDVASKHLKDTPGDGQRPVGSVVLQSLKEAFPCK